jgi:chorismate-pyruvate lyase
MRNLHMPSQLAELVAHFRVHATATEALTAWCATHLKQRATAIVVRVLADDEADHASYSGPLVISKSERLRYRKVQLRWGDTTVSEAENWYLPDRLPQVMRTRLLTDFVPFGEVVRDLQPDRRMVAMYSPDDLESGNLGTEPAMRRPDEVEGFSPLEHFILHVRAVMVTAAGVFIADLREHYRQELLA